MYYFYGRSRCTKLALAVKGGFAESVYEVTEAADVFRVADFRLCAVGWWMWSLTTLMKAGLMR